MNIKTTSLLCGATLCTISAMAAGSDSQRHKDSQRPKQNILFVLVDDLRPELGCFGSDVISPNIDALADEGVLFNKAYCNIGVSWASRGSLLTGARPTRTTFTAAMLRSDKQLPDVVAINSYFQSLGYSTYAEGKVFHHFPDQAAGWDSNHRLTKPLFVLEGNETYRPSTEAADVDDTAYFDGQTTQNAIAQLDKFAKSGEPFFYAVGFAKPHLPFCAPKKYWDLYNREDMVIPSTFNMKPGDGGINANFFPKYRELMDMYGDMKKETYVSEDKARELIHGYKACVSYIDAQIGMLMTKLKECGLDKNTAIVILGDHGWNLGEHGVWCKHSQFNTSVHSFIIINDPASKLHGRVNDQLVEYVDVYPTICDLAGVEQREGLDGESLLPLLQKKRAKHKGYVITRWAGTFGILTDEGYYYGESWSSNDEEFSKSGKEKVGWSFLFDHNIDPKETQNLTNDPKYAKIKERLKTLLMENRGNNFDSYKGVAVTNKK